MWLLRSKDSKTNSCLLRRFLLPPSSHLSACYQPRQTQPHFWKWRRMPRWWGSVIKNHSLNVSVNRKHYSYFWRHILGILFGGTFPSQMLKQCKINVTSPIFLQGIFGCQGFPVMIKELEKQAWDQQAHVHFCPDLFEWILPRWILVLFKWA